MLVWGGGNQLDRLMSGGRYIFAQDSDDDGDGVTECGGDCNDAGATVLPGAPEMCDGLDNDCNGLVDDSIAGVDSDGDGIPDACDFCAGFPNPDQSDPAACIGVAGGDGECLQAGMVLNAPIPDGEVTWVVERPVPPDEIRFSFEVVSCSGAQPIEFLLNGGVIETFVDPQALCTCPLVLHRLRVADAGLIASLWNIDGVNRIGVRKDPYDFNNFNGSVMGFVRAGVGSGVAQESADYCLFDVALNGCTPVTNCVAGIAFEAVDASVEVDVTPMDESVLARIPFAGSTPDGVFDIASIPDGPARLCVGPSGPPRFYAADSEGDLHLVDPATGTATPDGHLPFGVLEVAHDDASRDTFAQKDEPADRTLAEVDLVGGASLPGSPYLGLPLTGMEFFSGWLHGIDAGTPGTDPRFMKIDPGSGFSSQFGPRLQGSWVGLALDRENAVFHSVRLLGGVVTLMGLEVGLEEWRSLHPLPFMPTGLEYGPDGALYMSRATAGGAELYTLDTATGAVTLVGPMGIPDVVSLFTVRNLPRACRDVVKQGESSLGINGPCNAAPVASAGTDRTVECATAGGTVVSLDGSASSDPDSTPGSNDDIVLFEWLEDAGTSDVMLLGTGELLDVFLPLGAHSLTLQVTDSAGETATAGMSVDVRDTTAPAVMVTVSPALLWPPNHRMVPVMVGASISDVCDPAAAATLSGVVSNEPDDAPDGGDGYTTGDIQAVAGSPCGSQVVLRAERRGGGTGRIYTITCAGSDASGNASTGESRAIVPHNQGGVIEPIILEVVRDGVTGETVLEWTPVSGALAYNVLRGSVGSISRVASHTILDDVTCVAVNHAGTEITGGAADADPATGDTYYYTVESFDGLYSGYGTATGAAEILIGSGDPCM